MSSVNTGNVEGFAEGITKQDNTELFEGLRIKLNEDEEPKVRYQYIVDAAVAIMGSQFATVQMLYPEPGRVGKLRIVACHGFTPEAEQYWKWVYHYTCSSCGEVLRTRRRVIVPDYRTADFMQGSPTLNIFIEGGIFAAQSTPLYSRSGQLVGMVSTHWNKPYTPSQQQLDQLDKLAELAADLMQSTPVIED